MGKQVARQPLAGAKQGSQDGEELAIFAQHGLQAGRCAQRQIAKAVQRPIGIGRGDGFFQPDGRQAAAHQFQVFRGRFRIGKAAGLQISQKLRPRQGRIK
jgi:hypothetical protein